MDRAKQFLHHSAEHILNYMEEHDDKMTVEKVIYVAELCGKHNEICEFLEYVQKHKDSDYDFSIKGSVFGGAKKKMY